MRDNQPDGARERQRLPYLHRKIQGSADKRNIDDTCEVNISESDLVANLPRWAVWLGTSEEAAKSLRPGEEAHAQSSLTERGCYSWVV